MSNILVHDWSGHPFQIDLSRELARRGHSVEHAYFEGVQGPKGALERRQDDPENLHFNRRTLPKAYAKYGMFERRAQERQYGREMAAHIRDRRPDIVISANTPLDAQWLMEQATRETAGIFIFWLQDILGIGISQALRRRLGPLGAAGGLAYRILERRLLVRADHVVCICEEFSSLVRGWGVRAERCTVIENWAPRGEIVPLPKDNDWARRHGLTGKKVFLYAGTLGLKHNPKMLLDLAIAYAADDSVAVVVASEGLGADWLHERASKDNAPGLMQLPFQPYESLGEMLASADVLVALIEYAGAQFSVPSKILSYLAAGRAQLLAIPADNHAARLVRTADAGLTVPPDDSVAFLEAAGRLATDHALRDRLAVNARRCAEEKFDIVKITDRFLAAMEKARNGYRPVGPLRAPMRADY